MTEQETALAFELLKTPSPTGFEAPGQKVWLAAMRKLGLETHHDNYANAWAYWRCGKPGAPVLMLEAHADEIGFIVQEIRPDGFVRVNSIGGTDSAIARARRIQLLTPNGPVTAISGNTAIHMRRGSGEDKSPAIEDIYLDLGCQNRDEVLALGVAIGTPGVYTDEPLVLRGSRLVGRALDDRICTCILAMTAAKLVESGVTSGWDVVFVSSIMEEVGCIGAKLVAERLKPDACISLDVTHATDTPGADTAKFGEIKLGAGPALACGGFSHPLLANEIRAAAQAREIPLQIEATPARSGTNMDSVFQSACGITTSLISLPLRYMHSPVETAALADIDATRDLLVEVVSRRVSARDFAIEL